MAASDAEVMSHPARTESARATSEKKPKKIIVRGTRLKIPAASLETMICHAVSGVESRTSHCRPSFSLTKRETPQAIAIRMKNAVLSHSRIGCQIGSEWDANKEHSRMMPRITRPIHVAFR